MKMHEGCLLKLKATWRNLPNVVRVVQANEHKVWLVDVPRTFSMPRYLKTKELTSLYEEVR